MKLDKVQAMSDAELDAAIAKKMGWEEVEWVIKQQGCMSDNGAFRGRSPQGDVMLVPAFHLSLDACHAAEERLIADGVERVWVFELLRVLMPDARNTIMCGMAHLPQEVLVHVAHATARQRAEAILLAVQKGKTP